MGDIPDVHDICVALTCVPSRSAMTLARAGRPASTLCVAKPGAPTPARSIYHWPPSRSVVSSSQPLRFRRVTGDERGRATCDRPTRKASSRSAGPRARRCGGTSCGRAVAVGERAAASTHRRAPVSASERRAKCGGRLRLDGLGGRSRQPDRSSEILQGVTTAKPRTKVRKRALPRERM
jgi:hypothetical protein